MVICGDKPACPDPSNSSASSSGKETTVLSSRWTLGKCSSSGIKVSDISADIKRDLANNAFRKSTAFDEVLLALY